MAAVEDFGKWLEESAKEAALRSAKIDQQIEATSQQIEKNSQQIEYLRNLYTSQWGRLLESLVEPGSVQLFNDRGINVTMVSPRVRGKKNGKQYEIDLLLANTDEVVAVEVKSTLKVDDIDHFRGKLDTFLDFFSVYQGFKIYGAVAGVQINEGVSEYAYRCGMFVLGLGSEGLVHIRNDDKFEPKDFHPHHNE